jgi:hypothetical protein
VAGAGSPRPRDAQPARRRRGARRPPALHSRARHGRRYVSGHCGLGDSVLGVGVMVAVLGPLGLG